MTKAEKTAENRMVLKAWEDFKVNTEVDIPEYIGRLSTCTARVYENTNYYVLVSYNTAVALLVAFIDKHNGICYDVLRYVYEYTRTSAQHIAKFSHDYNAYYRMTYRI